jgi:GTP-binding protein EngB required for normal cell division
MSRAAGDLDRRLQALGRAAELAAGRLDAARVEAARAVVRRAGERLGLGLDATVAALAGPTGAGKSTLFNALAGGELVAAGRRRPTTSTAAAAVWGDVGDALLDWLEVPLRHRRADGRWDGLVLLDLPDFDSVEATHRLEVDRVVQLVDLLVWVADPQKYADAVLHERYLRPLAAHGDAMLVVLNQADLLAPREHAAAVEDLRRLVAADGVGELPVLAVSARTGEGLDALRAELDRRVAAREAAAARLAADVTTVVAGLDAGCGEGRRGPLGGRGDDGEGRRRRGSPGVERRDRERLVAALGESAGVPSVVRAVDAGHRRQGALAAGWPIVRWVRRLRPDPVRRLRLGDEDVRTSLPRATPVQRSVAASALRTVAAGAAEGLPDPWPGLVRGAATSHEDELPERLDRAVAGAELPSRRPLWWSAAGLLQRVAALAVLVGAGWLLVLAALGWLQLSDVLPLPEVEGIALPTLLLAGGALAGLLLGLVARIVNRVGARRRARRAERALHARVGEVADELVVEPVRAELAVREELCAELRRAHGGR